MSLKLYLIYIAFLIVFSKELLLINANLVLILVLIFVFSQLVSILYATVHRHYMDNYYHVKNRAAFYVNKEKIWFESILTSKKEGILLRSAMPICYMECSVVESLNKRFNFTYAPLPIV